MGEEKGEQGNRRIKKEEKQVDDKRMEGEEKNGDREGKKR